MDHDQHHPGPAKGKTAGPGAGKDPAPHAASPPAARPGGTDDAAVRLRMYRHGLGDCFLLRFPRAGRRDFRVLIDCGVIQGTPTVDGQGDVLAKVVGDLEEATRDGAAGKPTVDVLVATHEHWDHLAGFAVLTERFNAFDITQVWLAWTEDPKDATANRLRRARAEKVNALKLGLDQAREKLGLGGAPADKEVAEECDRVAE
ncbi:MAG TPA: MBL fold metallo-hydrolase, partial [Urbifossiella sp.]|nr:MBL fold metallo-hydrolase [Urbifossiella sp.]